MPDAGGAGVAEDGIGEAIKRRGADYAEKNAEFKEERPAP